MGTVPPPPPISFETFKARYRAGARTLAELDPDLIVWARRGERLRLAALVMVVVTLAVPCGFLVAKALLGGAR